MAGQDNGPFAVGSIAPTRQQAPPARGIAEPTSFLDAFQAVRRDQVETRNSGVREFETLAGLWERHREMERGVGHALPLSHSLTGAPDAERDSLERFMDRIIPTDRINAWIAGRPGALTDDEYEQRVEALRREHPDALSGIETRDQLAARLNARWYATRAAADQAQASGVEGGLGGFAGGVVGSFQDPPNAAAAILTGGAGAGRSLLSRMLVQGAIGGGLEALEAPERAVEAARYGGPSYTSEDAAADILFGGVAGAGFEVGGDLLKVASRPVRQAMGLHVDPVVRALAGEIDVSSRAFSRSGPIAADPALRGALDRLETFERDEAVIGPEDGEVVEQARHALQNFAPMPAVEPERGLNDLFPRGPAGPGTDAAVDYQGRRISLGSFDPAGLEIDPILRGDPLPADAWDPEAAGRALLFERRDGRVEVVDGQRRTAHARRLAETGDDTTVRLDGYLFREADGWTPDDLNVMRAIDSSGDDIVRAAGVLRANPTLINDRSLPVSGGPMADARGLARLSGEAFSAVEAGAAVPRHAALIGNMAANRPDLHLLLVQMMQKAKLDSPVAARALVSEALLEDSLALGDPRAEVFTPSARSRIIARAQLRTAVGGQLSRDPAFRATLAEAADAIEVAGTTLARTPQEAADAQDLAGLAMLDRLTAHDGGLIDGLAARLAKGDLDMDDAADQIVRGLREANALTADAKAYRTELLAPRAAGDAAVDALRAFDAPGGRGQAAQTEPKPEDAARESSPDPAWDDLPEIGDEERALGVLRACAPGGPA